MNINLRQDAPDQTDKVDVNELSEAIEQFKSVGAQILATEIKLKELKDQEKYINEHVIPDIMEKQNLKTLKLKDGSELSIGKKFYASFKSDKKEEGIQWLRDNGLGDIVDNNITVTFLITPNGVVFKPPHRKAKPLNFSMPIICMYYNKV